MNRLYKIVLAALFSCTLAYAQSTNITGGTNVSFTDQNFVGTTGTAGGNAATLSTITTFNSLNTTYQGGDGTDTAFFGTLTTSGGAGLRMTGVTPATITGGQAIGGDAGAAEQLNLTTVTAAAGGNGVGYSSAGFGPVAAVVTLNVDGLTARGGNGGDITATVGSFSNDANGGSGLAALSGKFRLQVTDSMLYGGDAGSVVTGGTEASTAIGGRGATIDRTPFTTYQNFYMDNVMAYGGDGGSIITKGAADVSGGNALGMLMPTTLAVIKSGTYIGGDAGTADSSGATATVTADGGYGLRFVGLAAAPDDTLIITNGTFTGGAGGSAKNNAGTISARGGDGVYAEYAVVHIFDGTYTGGAAGTTNGVAGRQGYGLRTLNSTVTVHDGRFSSVDFAGTGNISLLDGEIAAGLLFESDINTTITLGSTLKTSGDVRQQGGTVNVASWNDNQFNDTVIANGTMTFSGQTFNHAADETLTLLSPNSEVNFTGGLTTEAGSVINTVYDVPGKNASTIRGSDLVFGQGTDWTIDIGDDVIGNGVSFDLAVATTSLSNGLGAVEYEGTGGSWLGGLNVSTVGLRLVATYGYIPFEDALDIDPFSVLGQSMSALSDFTDISNSADTEYAALKASDGTTAEGLLRTALGSIEMANVLIDAQQLYADQLKDRSRSYLRFSGVGTPAGGPSGAAGPVELPPGYQLWARGYGSMIAQDESGEGQGYDAIIAGAAAGADKRFDHLLLGFGGGYSRTDLKGTYDGDGEADSVYGSIYSTISGDQAFLELQGTAGYSDVTTSGSDVTGGYAGAFDAGTASFLIGGGMGIPVFKEKVVMTPEASLLSTYYAREGFTESQTTSPTTGAWPDKVYDSYDTMSYLAAVGASFTMINQIDIMNYELGVKPEVRLHWLHEFNDNLDNEPYLMESAGGPYTSQQAVLQAREEDLFKLGLGVRMSKWASEDFEFGLDLDVILAQDYEAVVGSAKALVRF